MFAWTAHNCCLVQNQSGVIGKWYMFVVTCTEYIHAHVVKMYGRWKLSNCTPLRQQQPFFPFFHSNCCSTIDITYYCECIAFHRCHPPTPWFDEQSCPLSFLFLDCSYNSQEVNFPVECCGISWTISMPEVGIVLRFCCFQRVWHLCKTLFPCKKKDWLKKF